MADTPTAGPAPSNPAEPAPSSSTVPQPPPSGEAVTEGELQGGEAAGQPEDEAKTSLEQTGGAADPGAALDTPATASPLPPPPSHSGSATPAPPIVVEPAPTPSTSVSRPSVSSATHSPSPEPDKFAVPYSDAYRAAQSASRWNGLLGWARGVRLESSPGGAERGWDFGTGMYHVPRNSPYYTAGVERAPIDPSRPPPPLSLHQASVLVQHNPDALSDDDGTDSAAGSGFHESGRPRRSRAAMGLR
ncbi:hypothetical protein NBRC10512_005809 [Rhodotorula toruloides]|uniref:RHTO0S21e02058g1_1 n=2 Tax=Rhodotorula toruloides TaxID=5286 RepID=A0A061BG18_RHOTO|nr:uncharacterized protein RHTO_05688 [Rhodotorula toruloides NP11]EMS18758.1 hypothetical protein RHTO_05688 [Rhodotorula toruloides NP11]CDR48938.1 RHTO0S21e02058g1_1 [Rhodotorula toruloides]